MPYSQANVEAEIREIIDRALDESPTVAQAWLIQALMRRHRDHTGADADFYECCARRGVSDLVRTVLRTYEHPSLEEAAEHEVPLKGFEAFARLQRAYLVSRGKASMLVRLDHMTTAERLAKADEYERMGRGCLEHARQLRRYEVPKTA